MEGNSIQKSADPVLLCSLMMMMMMMLFVDDDAQIHMMMIMTMMMMIMALKSTSKNGLHTAGPARMHFACAGMLRRDGSRCRGAAYCVQACTPPAHA